MTGAPPRSAYIHVPFCARRCGYCNFTVAAGRPDLVESYLRAIQTELSWLGRPREVDTLYLGGGTPTQLDPDQLERLLRTVLAWHPLARGGELSIEANPADLDAAKARRLAELGVNRISLGVQSLDPRKLRLLDRDHRADQVRRAVRLARSRFDVVSIDMMFAVPDESLAAWSTDLEAAIALAVDHMSVYALTIEKGSAFWGRSVRGQIRPPDDTLGRRLFETAIDRLEDAGFEQYEVSSFARPGQRCRHNEVYWRAEPYYAAGPGAARYVDGRREVNHRSTTAYLKRVLAGRSPVAESEMLGPEDVAREMLVLGLRRIDGVDRRRFEARSGFSLDRLVGESLQPLVDLGLLVEEGDRVRLSRDGLLVSDAIWSRFLRR